ncbi:hypothetical protein POSPLADRAFT_1055103 [Postia placenta MAD-698-R-SB12]|uniref:Uncharacterized protein n=1 Tax=Postia placenta MAD-698-R-SB12 TaxID=670580 RepID=A0A1X6N7N6_9APHY|nr:hypothetical protein POSPLADRAFT_1055103 [Postia placenta MAD-698-R-SB12]OSX64486.1 hypothetical protein POSPLADRAFT_1055103 [Postia placenta MAD-698-R-SB12]
MFMTSTRHVSASILLRKQPAALSLDHSLSLSASVCTSLDRFHPCSGASLTGRVKADPSRMHPGPHGAARCSPRPARIPPSHAYRPLLTHSAASPPSAPAPVVPATCKAVLGRVSVPAPVSISSFYGRLCHPRLPALAPPANPTSPDAVEGTRCAVTASTRPPFTSLGAPSSRLPAPASSSSISHARSLRLRLSLASARRSLSPPPRTRPRARRIAANSHTLQTLCLPLAHVSFLNTRARVQIPRITVSPSHSRSLHFSRIPARAVCNLPISAQQVHDLQPAPAPASPNGIRPTHPAPLRHARRRTRFRSRTTPSITPAPALPSIIFTPYAHQPFNVGPWYLQHTKHDPTHGHFLSRVTAPSPAAYLTQHPHPNYAHLRRGARLGFSRVAASGPDMHPCTDSASMAGRARAAPMSASCRVFRTRAAGSRPPGNPPAGQHARRRRSREILHAQGKACASTHGTSCPPARRGCFPRRLRDAMTASALVTVGTGNSDGVSRQRAAPVCRMTGRRECADRRGCSAAQCKQQTRREVFGRAGQSVHTPCPSVNRTTSAGPHAVPRLRTEYDHYARPSCGITRPYAGVHDAHPAHIDALITSFAVLCCDTGRLTGCGQKAPGVCCVPSRCVVARRPRVQRLLNGPGCRVCHLPSVRGDACRARYSTAPTPVCSAPHAARRTPHVHACRPHGIKSPDARRAETVRVSLVTSPISQGLASSACGDLSGPPHGQSIRRLALPAAALVVSGVLVLVTLGAGTRASLSNDGLLDSLAQPTMLSSRPAAPLDMPSDLPGPPPMVDLCIPPSRPALSDPPDPPDAATPVLPRATATTRSARRLPSGGRTTLSRELLPPPPHAMTPRAVLKQTDGALSSVPSVSRSPVTPPLPGHPPSSPDFVHRTLGMQREKDGVAHAPELARCPPVQRAPVPHNTQSVQ